jgi:hypothetical protein
MDEDRKVVRVAGDDLEELILPAPQRAVVDPAGVRLAEAELAALGDESARVVRELAVELVLVGDADAGRRAVDHDRRRAPALPSTRRSAPCRGSRKPLSAPGVDAKPRARAWLRLTTFERSWRSGVPLVERHLVDPERLLQVWVKSPNQGLADGAGADGLWTIARLPCRSSLGRGSRDYDIAPARASSWRLRPGGRPARIHGRLLESRSFRHGRSRKEHDPLDDRRRAV